MNKNVCKINQVFKVIIGSIYIKPIVRERISLDCSFYNNKNCIESKSLVTILVTKVVSNDSIEGIIGEPVLSFFLITGNNYDSIFYEFITKILL